MPLFTGYSRFDALLAVHIMMLPLYPWQQRIL
jgi:hypothetical protein